MRPVLPILAVTLFVGCAQPTTPSALHSSAVIEVRNPVAMPYPSGDHDFFFTLAETGGISGATIQSLVTSIPGNTSTSDIGCWVRPMRVQPGSMLELTPTVLGYCSPTLNPAGLESVSLRVNYIDDDGRAGATHTTIPITR
jgi:hypothetical protein